MGNDVHPAGFAGCHDLVIDWPVYLECRKSNLGGFTNTFGFLRSDTRWSADSVFLLDAVILIYSDLTVPVPALWEGSDGSRREFAHFGSSRMGLRADSLRMKDRVARTT